MVIKVVWGFLVVIILSSGDVASGLFGPYKTEEECNVTYEWAVKKGSEVLPRVPKFDGAIVAQVNPCFSLPRKV